MLLNSPFTVRQLLVSSLLCLPILATAAAPTGLRVPTLAYDDHSVVLVWQKPADYTQVVDYKIYLNGKAIGTARDNAAKFSPVAPYFKAFYGAYQGDRHIKIDQHNFTVAGLTPNTQYRFAVRAVYPDGKLSAPSNSIVQRTAKPSSRCDITRHGAVGDGQTLNTKAIQNTIAACPSGGTVYIPKGTFKSGAIFLKSNMTLEVSEGATLLGSESPEDYPLSQGYKLYTYSSTQRPPSLINALNPDKREAGAFQNIRIVGKGTIDGNGWKRAAQASLKDETGREIPQFQFGTNASVDKFGILAGAQVKTALAEGLSLNAAYSQRRSSLMTLRGVENLYIGNITGWNPAFHGIMVLEGRNVTVNGVKLETWDVNNGDGLEFGNSEHITVFNSFFDTGDDCINFAAGTGEDAAQQEPQREAWIFNNYTRRGHGAVVIGSHTGAWIEDILAEDNVVNLTWIGLRGKSNNINGGGGRRIVYRDNAHRDLQREGFIFTLEYSDSNQLLDYKPAKQPGSFQDIQILRNTLEFTPDWKPTPVPNGPKRELSVVDFKALEIQGDVKSGAFHERISVDDLLLINTSSIKIDGLKDGVLRNIRFENYQGKNAPISAGNAPGLKQENIQAPTL